MRHDSENDFLAICCSETKSSLGTILEETSQRINKNRDKNTGKSTRQTSRCAFKIYFHFFIASDVQNVYKLFKWWKKLGTTFSYPSILGKRNTYLISHPVNETSHAQCGMRNRWCARKYSQNSTANPFFSFGFQETEISPGDRTWRGAAEDAGFDWRRRLISNQNDGLIGSYWNNGVGRGPRVDSWHIWRDDGRFAWIPDAHVERLLTVCFSFGTLWNFSSWTHI